VKKILVFALSAAFASFSAPLFAQGEVAVSIGRAQTRDMAPSQWAAGRVVSRRDIRLSSELNGTLEFVAEPGSFIKNGQLLARLDSTHWRLQLRNSESRIKQLQARLTYVDAQLRRLRTLSETNNTSRAALEEQESEREAMAQDLVAARIEKDRSVYELGKATINAAFDTLVVSRQRQAGEYVRTGDELLRALDMSQLEVEADIPLASLPLLQQGDSLTLRSDALAPGEGLRADAGADALLSGKVRQIVPVADSNSRRVKLLVSLPVTLFEDWGWITGLPVQVAVPVALAQQSVVVPRDALILRDGSAFVFRVDTEGKAERLQVNTGSGDGAWIAVLGEVQAGDQVIVRGAERLQPGQKVKILTEIAAKEFDGDSV
jgi:RND family efflux transporter MFP subunit